MCRFRFRFSHLGHVCWFVLFPTPSSQPCTLITLLFTLVMPKDLPPLSIDVAPTAFEGKAGSLLLELVVPVVRLKMSSFENR